MQKKALLLLLIALVLGGLATILVNSLLTREVEERAMEGVVETRKVVVAASDLITGVRLDRLTLKQVDLPSDHLPKDTFSNIDQLLGDKPPIVIKHIKQNEIILPYKISPHGARGGLPPKIPEDRRAITIEVSEITGVAGFVLPGTYVDLLLTSTIGQKGNKPATRTLLQNVLVLGVDQLSSEDEDNPKVVNAVTLEVTPNEGKRVTLAQHLGEVNLLLRNEFDASILVDEVITASNLLTSTAKPTKKVKVYRRVRRPTVEVIRGLEVEKRRVKEGKPLPEQGDTKQEGKK